MSPARERRPRCFGQALETGEVLLQASEEHHLLKVLRLQAGDRVEVVDGGKVFLAEAIAVDRRSLRLRTLGELQNEPLDAAPIHLAPAVLHPPAMERLLQLAVELHVEAITPILTERTQHHRLSDKLLDRWRKIVQEACKQARRSSVPSLQEPVELETFLAAAPGGPPDSTLRLCLSPTHPTLETHQLAHLPRPSAILLLQGPEGGWTDRELQAIQAVEYQVWSLGRAVFRAETCPLVAMTLLHQAFGSLFRVAPETPEC